MNSAARVVTRLPAQAALQVPSDPAASTAGADFTAALEAAGVAEPDSSIPEGMQPATDVPAGSTDALVADAEDGDEVSDAALSLLQGMLASAVNAPRNPAVDTDAAPAGEPDGESAITPANVIATGATAAVDLQRTRTAKTGSSQDVQSPVPGDAIASALLADGAETNDASGKSSMGERLIGALAEHASLRTDGGAASAVTDRNSTTVQNLYTSTRETLASSSGQVSSRPEVVHSTVGSPRWANELGSRLAMMSVRGQQEGSLSLTPEHLGPLEVRITVNQDTTNVWFGAQHADTRAALADALPRLREMFSASGLSLGQAGVSQEMPRQETRRGADQVSRLAASADPLDVLPVAAARVRSGLLDTWA